MDARLCTRCQQITTAAAHGLCPACIVAQTEKTRVGQGHPPRVEDPAVLHDIAGIFRDATAAEDVA